jgi:hypothetical protein
MLAITWGMHEPLAIEQLSSDMSFNIKYFCDIIIAKFLEVL